MNNKKIYQKIIAIVLLFGVLGFQTAVRIAAMDRSTTSANFNIQNVSFCLKDCKELGLLLKEKSVGSPTQLNKWFALLPTVPNIPIVYCYRDERVRGYKSYSYVGFVSQCAGMLANDLKKVIENCFERSGCLNTIIL
ncbi:MAG: hypothetical protein NkDv07_0290 [Candidatus Improbicoccus devescovinae]|nr:MAG: hypothetical protein NkDv07_0290 [Candidatus Improbicoccus devescovinae]